MQNARLYSPLDTIDIKNLEYNNMTSEEKKYILNYNQGRRNVNFLPDHHAQIL